MFRHFQDIYKSSALQIVRMEENGPLACALLAEMSKQERAGQKVSMDEAEALLDKIIKENLADLPTPIPQAKLLIKMWTHPSKPILQKSGEAPNWILSIPYEVRRGFSFIAGLGRDDEPISTETTFSQIVTSLGKLREGIETDPEVVLEQAKAKRDLWQSRVDRLTAGEEIEVLAPGRVREMSGSIRESLDRLLTDFKGVKETFIAINRKIEADMQRQHDNPGDILALAFEEAGALLNSPQGISYRAFQDAYLSNESSSEPLYLLLKSVLAIQPQLKSDLGDLPDLIYRADREIRDVICGMAAQMNRFLEIQRQQKEQVILKSLYELATLMKGCVATKPLPWRYNLGLEMPGNFSISGLWIPNIRISEGRPEKLEAEPTPPLERIPSVGNRLRYFRFIATAKQKIQALDGKKTNITDLLRDAPPSCTLELLPYLSFASEDAENHPHEVDSKQRVTIPGADGVGYEMPSITFYAH
jgi:hypothetical protein